ncbi:MAG: carboxypeptidase-like regulatory domain-containing protein [Saprospiraceae bacterium]|nr:carboxypeptidase-like regulatory domain-containing protein [Saprospiraceae bacterium]
MKKCILCSSALLVVFFALPQCNTGKQKIPPEINSTGVAGVDYLRPIQIHVMDHDTGKPLSNVVVTLIRPGESHPPQSTNPNGELSAHYNVQNNDLLRFELATKRTVSIGLIDISTLSYIGVHLWNNPAMPPIISGRVGGTNGVNYPNVTISNTIPNSTESVTSLFNGRYALEFSSPPQPFNLAYTRQAGAATMTVTVDGGGSATIDVAFDDTPFLPDSLNMPGQNK